MPEGQSILVISTEDGRLIFYNIKQTTEAESTAKKSFASCQAIAQMGGVAAGFIGRIKDFEVLPVAKSGESTTAPLLFITGSSDGAVRTWRLDALELSQESKDEEVLPQVGKLLGTHETGHRITCLAAFIMDGPAEGPADEDDEVEGAEDDEESDSDSE